MKSSAWISEDGRYRYSLTRDWTDEIPHCEDHHDANVCPPNCRQHMGTAVFVMLNPSTADAAQDDPTIRRCIGFAKSWGCRRLVVVNLYAYRTAYPEQLWTLTDDPIGPQNDALLSRVASEYRGLVCAWGANARASRVDHFRRRVNAVDAKLFSLGLTKRGQPRHPLYLPKAAALSPWPLPTGDGGNK